MAQSVSRQYILIIFVIGAAFCLAVAALAQTYCGGVVVLSSATPGATPTPPVLTNPQNPIAYGADPTGVNDSFPAFKAALAVGDLDVHAGTYLLVPTYGSNGYSPASGRNIYCENSSLPPTPANAAVIIKVIAAPTGGFSIFNEWSNGTLYGCEFEGYHYPNTTWTGDTNAAAGDSVVLQFSGHDWNAYNNGFDGWQGSTAPIAINEASASQYAAGVWPFNMNISYNRFANCNVRSVEIDYGKNVQITHNSMTDCTTTAEIQDWHWVGMSALFDSNTVTNIVGANGGSTNGITNTANGGAVCISGISNNSADDKFCPTYSPSCSAGCPSDYSGNTWSNNIMNASVTSYLIENCWGNPAGSCNPPVYRNNTLSGSWARQATPGNPNANSWGPGSNE